MNHSSVSVLEMLGSEHQKKVAFGIHSQIFLIYWIFPFDLEAFVVPVSSVLICLRGLVGVDWRRLKLPLRNL